jgi:hypothetical protein
LRDRFRSWGGVRGVKQHRPTFHLTNPTGIRIKPNRQQPKGKKNDLSRLSEGRRSWGNAKPRHCRSFRVGYTKKWLQPSSA